MLCRVLCRGSLFLDDTHMASGGAWSASSVPGPHGAGYYNERMLSEPRYRLQQQAYGFEVLFAHFMGVWISWMRKCTRRPTRVLVVLGMECLVEDQCFRVPEGKGHVYCELGRGLVEAVEKDGGLDFYELGRFAGKTMSFVPAIPRVRMLLNPLYGVLTGARLTGDTDWRGMGRHAWWRKIRGSHWREVRAEWLGPPLAVLRELMYIVEKRLKYSFLKEKHYNITAEVLDVYHDTTLTGFGLYSEGLGDKTAALEMGGELAAEVAGVDLLRKQTGTTELAGVVQSFMGLVRDAGMLRRLRGRRVKVHLDNLEDVLLLSKYRIGGEQRVGKYVLARALWRLLDDNGLWFEFVHVPTLENPSDRASRVREFREVRTSNATFALLWRFSGGYTRDLMSSVACKGGCELRAGLGYYARFYDAAADGVNVFAQDIAMGPDGSRERSYCFPGRMCEALCRLVLESRADATLVVPMYKGVRPGYLARLEAHVIRRVSVGTGFAEIRRPSGWEPYEMDEHEALVVRF